jgi:hypothetical protein
MTLCQAGEQEERGHSDGAKLDHDALVVTGLNDGENCENLHWRRVILAQSLFPLHLLPLCFTSLICNR